MSAPWRSALVTGASAGIGASLVRLLAERGVARVVVVARRGDALEALAAEVHADQPGTSVEVLVADLADPDGCAAVEARLAADDEPIDLLVNNAGFGTAGAFWELPLDGEAREVALNAVAVLRLSHAALGPMVARPGAVVNVSSLASNQPTPGMATYGATKAFVTMFTEGLAQDLRAPGSRPRPCCPATPAPSSPPPWAATGRTPRRRRRSRPWPRPSPG
ncbi:MAG: SDR family NAD(P)-dependent oxidoreductase [Acidimicrobiales bacterium]